MLDEFGAPSCISRWREAVQSDAYFNDSLSCCNCCEWRSRIVSVTDLVVAMRESVNSRRIQEHHSDATHRYLPPTEKHGFAVDFDAFINGLRSALSLR